jgi:hypothetical protein
MMFHPPRIVGGSVRAPANDPSLRSREKRLPRKRLTPHHPVSKSSLKVMAATAILAAHVHVGNVYLAVSDYGYVGIDYRYGENESFGNYGISGRGNLMNHEAGAFQMNEKMKDQMNEKTKNTMNEEMKDEMSDEISGKMGDVKDKNDIKGDHEPKAGFLSKQQECHSSKASSNSMKDSFGIFDFFSCRSWKNCRSLKNCRREVQVGDEREKPQKSVDVADVVDRMNKLKLDLGGAGGKDLSFVGGGGEHSSKKDNAGGGGGGYDSNKEKNASSTGDGSKKQDNNDHRKGHHLVEESDDQNQQKTPNQELQQHSSSRVEDDQFFSGVKKDQIRASVSKQQHLNDNDELMVDPKDEEDNDNCELKPSQLKALEPSRDMVLKSTQQKLDGPSQQEGQTEQQQPKQIGKHDIQIQALMK